MSLVACWTDARNTRPCMSRLNFVGRFDSIKVSCCVFFAKNERSLLRILNLSNIRRNIHSWRRACRPGRKAGTKAGGYPLLREPYLLPQSIEHLSCVTKDDSKKVFLSLNNSDGVSYIAATTKTTKAAATVSINWWVWRNPTAAVA